MLTLGCYEYWEGDDYCDDGCNNAANNFDGGDCCGSDVDTTWCTQCQCLEGGSGGSEGDQNIFCYSFMHNIVPKSLFSYSYLSVYL